MSSVSRLCLHLVSSQCLLSVSRLLSVSCLLSVSRLLSVSTLLSCILSVTRQVSQLHPHQEDEAECWLPGGVRISDMQKCFYRFDICQFSGFIGLMKQTRGLRQFSCLSALSGLGGLKNNLFLRDMKVSGSRLYCSFYSFSCAKLALAISVFHPLNF